MADSKCSIYKCTKGGCDIMRHCDLCGNWWVCDKHASLLSHKRCQSKFYFKVKFSEKDQAKECGLFYDMEYKKWFAQNKKSYDLAMQLFDPIEA